MAPLVLQVLMSDFTADDSARRTQLLNLVGDGAHSSRCVERATDIDSLEMLRYTHGTRVDPTRNSANDQAYISGAACTWTPGNTECLTLPARLQSNTHGLCGISATRHPVST